MQFQVPQNISMEDKIIGSLTAIQFGIIVLGGGLSFFVGTSTTIPKPINTGLGIILALLTAVLAVGKFNDQPMYRFFKFIIAFVLTPKVRVWHKGSVETVLVKPNPMSAQKTAVRTVKHVSKQDIARLAVVLDSRGATGATKRSLTGR